MCAPAGITSVHPAAVGYCILLAQPLAAALLPLVERLQAAQGSSGDSKGDDSSGSARPSRRRRAGAALVALLLAGMLAFYAVRTVTRNEDWRDEERLFRAAQQVR